MSSPSASFRDRAERLLDRLPEAERRSPPKRIVGIWLIAVSLFRHGEGSAEVADIELARDGATLKVL
jgi:hypothetical protein